MISSLIFNRTKTIKKKWWYTLFSKPHVYLKDLLLNTIYIGIITTIIFLLFENVSTEHHQTIPLGFHSVIGLVMGLLLVFRTNTAYDRWWKARELFSKLEALYLHFISKTKKEITDNNLRKTVGNHLIESLTVLGSFLTNKINKEKKKQFIRIIYNLQEIDNKEKFGVDSINKEIIDTFTSLERIRDTPIPLSYSLHIKVSLYLYFLTLPFGIFYELGYWSIPLVMILYYIVAGIEIISNEIENPFYGDPNDLPVNSYIHELKTEINQTMINL